MSAQADTSTTGTRLRRIHELDALRGIAAMGVVFSHYAAHFDARPLATLLHPFYNAGFLLVDFFFVLSGYVIGRAYWNDRRQWHALRSIWARVARLYPLHFFTLVVTVILVGTLPPAAADLNFNSPNNDLGHLLLNLVLLNQIGLQDGWSFNTPAWSISTEFVVNVAFLCCIALAARTRTIVAGALIVAGSIGFAVMRPPLLEGQMAFGFLDVNLLRCALGFAAGVVVYLVVDRLRAGQRLAASPHSADVLGGCALVAMTMLMMASGRHPPVSHYLLSIAIAVACVVFIPFSRTLKAILCRRWLVFLGDISYSIYLVHFPLQLALYWLAQRSGWSLAYDAPASLLAYIAAVIGIAALTHRYVELPWQSRLLALTAPRKERPA